MIPKWVGDALTIQVPIRDSFWNAPGWRQLGRPIWSSIPDVQYPYDPQVLEAIREFWPEACYLQRKLVFLSPQDTGGVVYKKVFTHHALASRLWNPRTEPHDAFISQPVDADALKPNRWEIIFEERDEKGRVVNPWGTQNLPGNYIPFDWSAYCIARNDYDDRISSAEKERRRINKVLARLETESRQKKEMWDYMQRDVQRWAGPRLAEVSDVEITEYCRAQEAQWEAAYRKYQEEKRRLAESKPLRFALGKCEVN